MRAGAVVGGGAHTCGLTISGDALCYGDEIANLRIEFGVAMTKRVRLGFRVKGIVPESLSATGHTELFGRWPGQSHIGLNIRNRLK